MLDHAMQGIRQEFQDQVQFRLSTTLIAEECTPETNDVWVAIKFFEDLHLTVFLLHAD